LRSSPTVKSDAFSPSINSHPLLKISKPISLPSPTKRVWRVSSICQSMRISLCPTRPINTSYSADLRASNCQKRKRPSSDISAANASKTDWNNVRVLLLRPGRQRGQWRGFGGSNWRAWGGRRGRRRKWRGWKMISTLLYLEVSSTQGLLGGL
jgi:hypothetical protein